MKWKDLLVAIVIIIVIIIAYKITPLPKKTKTGGTVNYAPNGYKKTVQSTIKGRVIEIEQNGLFWVTVENKKFPFSYDVFKLPKDWENSYPKDFIQVGDSLYKKSNNDTFYLIREDSKCFYVLLN